MSSATAALALTAVAASIIVSLARSGWLRRSRLDLAAALVFGSSGIGHAVHAAADLTSDGRADMWYLSGWDVLTAGAAVAYLWLRRVTGVAEEGGSLYGGVRHRQHELAGQVMAANVREELAAERAAAAEQRLARIFATASVGLAVVERGGSIARSNPALGAIIGRGERAVGANLVDLLVAGDRPAVEALVRRAGNGGDVVEVHIQRPDGAEVRGRLSVTPLVEDDGSMLVQIEDSTEIRQAEERLEHLAHHDPLTGLANRLLFHVRAAGALRQANRTGCYVGCLFVDLDHFKAVNDSLGHAAGDRVLTTMAARLVEAVRPEDTVARMGGDDFCILLVGLEHQAEVEVVAERVRRAVDRFVDIDGLQVVTSASLGVAVAVPGDRATSETLVRDADTALCRAKEGGPRRTVLFDVELREDALRQLHMDAVPGRG